MSTYSVSHVDRFWPFARHIADLDGDRTTALREHRRSNPINSDTVCMTGLIYYK